MILHLIKIIQIRLTQLLILNTAFQKRSFVELKVYDIFGNEVATLVNQEQMAGVYRADFTGKGL